MTLTPADQRRAQQLALDYEARRLFPTPAECRAAAERVVKEEADKQQRRSVRTDTAPKLF